MRRAMFLLPLLLGGCSCQRDTSQDRPPAHASADAAQDTASDRTLADIPVPVLGAVAAGADSEGKVVRQYLNAVMRGDRSAADAYWSGSHSASGADAALRDLPGLRTLRVDTDLPIARDDQTPSRLREVPVSIRAATHDGVQRYTGWYRLRPKPDGSGWEIYAATLQPVLD